MKPEEYRSLINKNKQSKINFIINSVKTNLNSFSYGHDGTSTYSTADVKLSKSDIDSIMNSLNSEYAGIYGFKIEVLSQTSTIATRYSVKVTYTYKL